MSICLFTKKMSKVNKNNKLLNRKNSAKIPIMWYKFVVVVNNAFKEPTVALYLKTANCNSNSIDLSTALFSEQQIKKVIKWLQSNKKIMLNLRKDSYVAINIIAITTVSSPNTIASKKKYPNKRKQAIVLGLS